MSGIIFYPSNHGVIIKGVNDQYADGKMAKLYKNFIGDSNDRTENYKKWLLGVLRQNNCKRILDVACGTGIDSVMLLEEGFDVVSTDGSDKMLQYALNIRWDRRKDSIFDKWVIKESNWCELYDNIEELVGDGFDAVICFGSSFAHMVDSYGDQREHKLAIRNFEKCLKPGGLLLIDHRNYEEILNGGSAPKKCVFYDSKHITQITNSVLTVQGKPALIIRDYLLKPDENRNEADHTEDEHYDKLRLLFHPHQVNDFRALLKSAFGERAKYVTYGDFQDLSVVKNPGFYIHQVQKAF